MLVKLQDLKNWLEITGSGSDALLTQLATGLGAEADLFCRRKLEKQTKTELFDPVGQSLFVAAYPIIAITSIKESLDQDWENVEALTAGDDYVIYADRGQIARKWTVWLPGRQTVQVVYSGGYVDPVTTPGTGEQAVPADLQRAILMQARYEWQRKDRVGATRITMQDGSAAFEQPIDLLPTVKQVLERYRRYA
jgi:hypothetical protein